ncbi:MAG: hypothetical protein V3S46_02375 [Nitrospinota bacterium]
MIEKKIIALTIFLAFILPAFASAGEKAKLVFDLSKVETDDSWEEVRLEEGSMGKWCGNDMLFFYGDGKYSSFNPQTDKITRYELEKNRSYWFRDCTKDGAYIFLRRSIYPKKGSKLPKERHFLEIYEAKNMRKLGSLPMPSWHLVTPLVSPDGKMLTWHKGETISLGKGRTLTLVPLYDLKNNLVGEKWSRDGKKIYFKHYLDQSRLFEYDVANGNIKVVPEDDDRLLELTVFIIHPDGSKYKSFSQPNELIEQPPNTVYASIKSDDWHKIDKKLTTALANSALNRKALIGNMFLHIYEWDSAKEGLTGFYLLERNSGELKRIVKGNTEQPLVFSPDGKMISYTKPSRIVGNAVYHDIYILRKKKDRQIEPKPNK